MSRLATILLSIIILIIVCACILNAVRSIYQPCYLNCPQEMVLRARGTRTDVLTDTSTGVHLFGLDGMPKSWVFVLKMGVFTER